MEEVFDVSKNSLSREIPTELGKVVRMANNFLLSTNGFSSAIPTELGTLIYMSSRFELEVNSLSSTVPTQLGRLIWMKKGMMLASNQLCGDIPDEVQALSGRVTAGWEVATGNSIGTMCDEALRQPSLPSSPQPTQFDTPHVEWIDDSDDAYNVSIVSFGGLVCGDGAEPVPLSPSKDVCAKPCRGQCNCAFAFDHHAYSSSLLFNDCRSYDTWSGDCSADELQKVLQSVQRLAAAQFVMAWACLALSLVVLSLGVCIKLVGVDIDTATETETEGLELPLTGGLPLSLSGPR